MLISVGRRFILAMGRMLKFASVFMFKLDAKLLGSIHDRLSDADFSFYAELENDILEYIEQQILEQLEAAKVAATKGLEAAQEKVTAAQKAWEGAISDAQNKVDAAEKKWEDYEKSVRSASQPVIDHYLSEISRLEGEVDKTSKDFDNAMRTAERAVEQANQDRATALAKAHQAVENAKNSMDNAINNAERGLDSAEAALSNAFGDARRAIDSAQRDVDGIQGKIDGIMSTIHDYENASVLEFWKKGAIPELWIAVGTLETAKGVATGVLDAAKGVLNGTEYVEKETAVKAARDVLEGAKATGNAALEGAQGALTTADATSKVVVDTAEATLNGVRTGTELVAFQTAKEALEQFKNASKAAYEAAVAAIKGLMESAAFIGFNAAKAGLEVAKHSTKLLDAAKATLALAEKATQATLTVVEDMAKLAAHAVNIETIILSGTLRGILGIGGGTARPLSAEIKGYIAGNWFDIKAEFDPRAPVEFITAIFKQ